MIYLWPYNKYSESAKVLSNALGVRRVSGNKSLKSGTKLINWGNSVEVLNYSNKVVLNNPSSVALATHKLHTLSTLKAHNIPTVEFTTCKATALSWRNETSIIYARHLCSSHSGNGIEVVTSEMQLPTAPLYTLGFNKSHEYRIHVGGTHIIDAVKKRKRTGATSNDFIKNVSNGWVFCRDHLEVPALVASTAIAAVDSLGLDFGAVDILYKESTQEVRVLEINTAPGLEGTTLSRYVNYFRKELL
jgi:glutathione synthase/RimK-type ligase-like ATP-grasp enzyme